MPSDKLKLKVIRAGNLAPGDVHERCTDCEIHHEAVNAEKNGEGFILLKGKKEAVAAAASLLFQDVMIVPFSYVFPGESKEAAQ